jgi:hypothetical protein
MFVCIVSIVSNSCVIYFVCFCRIDTTTHANRHMRAAHISHSGLVGVCGNRSCEDAVFKFGPQRIQKRRDSGGGYLVCTSRTNNTQSIFAATVTLDTVIAPQICYSSTNMFRT